MTHRHRALVFGLVLAAGASSLAAGCAPAPSRPITQNQEPAVMLQLPAHVVVGEPAVFSGQGTQDVDGTLASVRLEPGDGSADVSVPLPALKVTHTYDTPGLVTVALVVTDDDGLVGRARMPLVVHPTVAEPGVPPDEPGVPPEEPAGPLDADSDGLFDDVDPTPTQFSGLLADVFAIDVPFARDWLGRQKAEDVVAALADAESLAEPLAQMPLAAGWRTLAATSAALDTALGAAPGAGPDGAPGLPSVSEAFALRFTGTLTPPVGAASLEVELGADDLAVVFIDGEPVASADEEFATDLLRATRVPARSEVLALYGPVDIEILLANEAGPYGWDVALRFLDANGAVMPDAPTQGSFLLP